MTTKPKLYAYEIDCFGNGDVIWEIFTEYHEFLSTQQAENFGNFLDSALAFGYDVLINTYESWEAMDNV